MLKRYVLYAMVLFLLAGCASLSDQWERPLILDNKTERDKRLAMKNWSLSGRLSLRDGKQSRMSLIKWRHNKALDIWVLSSLIGRTVAEISHTGGVTYIKEPGKSKMGLSDQELAEAFGFVLPLQHLSYWVRGLVDDRELDEARMKKRYMINGFEQNGWAVSLARYAREGEVVLPSKVVISKGDLKIIIVVDKWQVE